MLLRQLWVPPVTQYAQGAGASLLLAERVLVGLAVCWELGARSWRRWALPLLVRWPVSYTHLTLPTKA